MISLFAKDQAVVRRLKHKASVLVRRFRFRTIDADDLVQETLKKAQQYLGTFRGSTKGELIVWMDRILQTTAADLLRRQAGKKAPIENKSPSGIQAAEKTPSSNARHRESAVRLRDAVSRMPSPYREVVLLRYQEQLDHDQIAMRLNRTVVAVKQQWVRGLRWLKGQEKLDEL